MDALQNYFQVRQKVEDIAAKTGRDPEGITIVAVTKNHPLEAIVPAYDAGCRNFGESRIQEALPKMEHAPKGINWHFIGTLQKNKVSKAVGRFCLIHSVDSLELAKKISETSGQANLTTPILLQVNTSEEPTKHGLTQKEWEAVLDQLISLNSLEIGGLMTIAPLTDDQALIRKSFSSLRRFKEELSSQIPNKDAFRHLSMGMSHDYPIAIEEGATLLRIGTDIFGSRIGK